MIALWPILFTFIIQKAVENPDDFQPIFHMAFMNIKAKYYPLILLIVYLVLISDTYIPVDIIIAIGLGFIAKYTDYYYFDILSDVRMNELEQKSRLTKFKSHPSTFI